MDVLLIELINLILRWLHIVAAMAWIGSSFYFIALDLSLRPRDHLPAQAYGEAWQVHGGGFYHLVKYLVAPARMPDHLTWFKWEAYTTWMSGFALMIVVYYLNPELFLIDRSVLDMGPQEAVLVSVSALAATWATYEGLCRSRLRANQTLVAIIGYVYLVALTYGFTHVFGGRGAFVHIGALIGTIMVANVFVVIIPNQKKTIDALVNGRAPDPHWGAESKLRSVHNNYLTLPVVVMMISGHYPLLFATKYNYLIVALVLLLGPVIRHFFNERHAGRKSPWWVWGVAALLMFAIFWLTGAGPRDGVVSLPANAPKATFAQVEEIVVSRCSMCHGPETAWPGIAAAPKGIMLHDEAFIRQYRHLIEVAAVRSDAMPPGNVTDMTREERAIIAAWLASGER
jgi:uncharacterized membrane protein